MLFDFTIIGFGVIGVEMLHGIKKHLLKKKQKIIKKKNCLYMAQLIKPFYPHR